MLHFFLRIAVALLTFAVGLATAALFGATKSVPPPNYYFGETETHHHCRMHDGVFRESFNEGARPSFDTLNGRKFKVKGEVKDGALVRAEIEAEGDAAPAAPSQK